MIIIVNIPGFKLSHYLALLIQALYFISIIYSVATSLQLQ